MMNLFARILSHAFGLIVVALLVIGLIYRGKLFPEWELPDFLALDTAPETAGEAASGDVQRDGEPAAPVEPAVEEPALAEAATEAPGAPPADTVAAEDTSADEAMPAAVEPVPEMVEAEPEMTEEGIAAVVEAPSDGGDVDGTVGEPVPAPAEAAPAIVQEGGEPVTDTTMEAPPAPDTTPAADAGRADEVPAPAAAPQAAADTSYRVLAAAREAYWLRDYGLAEQKYQDLIALEPDNPDGYGELGNMYFSRGNWEQASAAYYEAGVRLVDQGLVREARQLVEVIRGLNGTQADALAEKVQSAGQ